MAQQRNLPGTSSTISGINLPARVHIDGLSSSVTRNSINAIVPEIRPTLAQIKEWESTLRIVPGAPGGVRCVYCGEKATQLDHFHNLTQNKLPTGYITEIYNLVPSCGPCNSSKGSSDWDVWMQAATPGVPVGGTSSDPDLRARIALLGEFQKWSNQSITPLAVIDTLGQSEWDLYKQELAAIVTLMKVARKRSDQFRQKLREAYDALKKDS